MHKRWGANVGLNWPHRPREPQKNTLLPQELRPSMRTRLRSGSLWTRTPEARSSRLKPSGSFLRNSSSGVTVTLFRSTLLGAISSAFRPAELTKTGLELQWSTDRWRYILLIVRLPVASYKIRARALLKKIKQRKSILLDQILLALKQKGSSLKRLRPPCHYPPQKTIIILTVSYFIVFYCRLLDMSCYSDGGLNFTIKTV